MSQRGEEGEGEEGRGKGEKCILGNNTLKVEIHKVTRLGRIPKICFHMHAYSHIHVHTCTHTHTHTHTHIQLLPLSSLSCSQTSPFPSPSLPTSPFPFPKGLSGRSLYWFILVFIRMLYFDRCDFILRPIKANNNNKTFVILNESKCFSNQVNSPTSEGRVGCDYAFVPVFPHTFCGLSTASQIFLIIFFLRKIWGHMWLVYSILG